MGGYPNDPDAKKAIKALKKDFGWEYDDDVAAAAHPCGWLRCGDDSLAHNERCAIVVYKTGNDSARALWKAARKCTHGQAPDRRQW